MRIWLVQLEDLDNQRLLGAHNEIHMAVGLIRDSIKRERVHGLLKDWYHSKGFAAIEHYHALCVEEMYRRGWSGHQTPLNFPFELWAQVLAGRSTVKYVDNHWPPTFVTLEAFLKDAKDLNERWTKEGKTEQIERFRQKYGPNMEKAIGMLV